MAGCKRWDIRRGVETEARADRISLFRAEGWAAEALDLGNCLRLMPCPRLNLASQPPLKEGWLLPALIL